MRIQRLAIALTAINLVILILAVILVLRPAVSPDVTPVLRGRALEIVDDRGEVRAQLVVVPADAPEGGQAYPETVLFRLMDSNGLPGVKVSTSLDGSGLLLSRESQTQVWNGVQILAQGSVSSIRLQNEDGQEQIIQP